MPMVTGETVKQALRDLYDYEISAEDAAALAHGAGAMITLAGHLPALGLEGVEPPFDYRVILADADRLAKAKPS